MRKLNRILALALAVVMVFALAACGGFESDMARAVKELQSVESVHADMTLDIGFAADIALDMGSDSGTDGETTSLPMTVTMGMDTDGSLTSGSVDLDIFGFPVSALYVVETKGDTCDLYISLDGGETWQSQLGISTQELQSADNVIGVNGDVSGTIGFYLEFASKFGDGVDETLDGVDCVRYDGAFPGDKLTEAMNMSGGAHFDTVPEGTTLPDAPISIWLEKDSGLPKRISLDMTDAMGQYMLGLLTSSGAPEDMLQVTNVSIEVDLSDYDNAQPMSPPEL